MVRLISRSGTKLGLQHTGSVAWQAPNRELCFWHGSFLPCNPCLNFTPMGIVSAARLKLPTRLNHLQCELPGS